MAKKIKKSTISASLFTAKSLEDYHRLARTKPGNIEDTNEMILEHLAYLEEALRDGKVAIKGDCYAYTPTDGSMQNWYASDGGEMKADSLLGLLCHAMGHDVQNIEIHGCWDLDSGWFLMPARGAQRQEDYETNR